MSETAGAPGSDLGEIPYLLEHPGWEGFRRRAERLVSLAVGHAAGDYLSFVGRLASAQAEAALSLSQRPSPPSVSRPLDSARVPDGVLPVAVRLAEQLGHAPMPEEARSNLLALSRMSDERIRSVAARILAGETTRGDLGSAPVVGAALEVVFAAQARSLPVGEVPRKDDGSCPACGFVPLGGVVLAANKLRYLVCALCGTRWHSIRSQCIACRSGARVQYLTIDGGARGAAVAEACDDCQAYTKLFYEERAPGIEPAADDLASLALDLLVEEQGFARLGRSLYLASALA